jgi:hypothetical protein
LTERGFYKRATHALRYWLLRRLPTCKQTVAVISAVVGAPAHPARARDDEAPPLGLHLVRPLPRTATPHARHSAHSRRASPGRRLTQRRRPLPARPRAPEARTQRASGLNFSSQAEPLCKDFSAADDQSTRDTCGRENTRRASVHIALAEAQAVRQKADADLQGGDRKCLRFIRARAAILKNLLLRLHLLACGACARLLRQLQFLRQLICLHNCSEGGASFPSVSLSPAARERIKLALRQKERPGLS